MTPSETSASRYTQLEALQERVVALEAELRVLRGAIVRAMRCTCPVGWGQGRDANCPKHGMAAPVEGERVGGELNGQQVPTCPDCGGAAVLVEVGVETVVTPGMVPVTARPSRQGPQARCSEGHWFTLDGHPSPGPISYTVDGL